MNKEEKKEYNKKYREANKERIEAYRQTEEYKERRRQYAREYYKKPHNREKANARARARWAKVIETRGYRRKVQEDIKLSESYRKRNVNRRVKNKETGKDKEIINRQNAWLKQQYALYT